MRWPWQRPDRPQAINHTARLADGDRVLRPGEPVTELCPQQAAAVEAHESGWQEALQEARNAVAEVPARAYGGSVRAAGVEASE